MAPESRLFPDSSLFEIVQYVSYGLSLSRDRRVGAKKVAKIRFDSQSNSQVTVPTEPISFIN
jgi:hypothetical protein